MVKILNPLYRKTLIYGTMTCMLKNQILVSIFFRYYFDIVFDVFFDFFFFD